MRCACRAVLILILLATPAAARRQQLDDETVWHAFIGWLRAAPADVNPIAGHAAALEARGVPDPEIRRRMAVVMRLLNERADWVEVHFDKVFARPVTGDPARDGFDATPSALLVETVAAVTPGTALDAGMGQGRNAIYLAGRGWETTGFDISREAVAAARRNAARAGVSLDAVKASYAQFDFGTAKWDLIVLAFAWAPVTDPSFVLKLHRSLKPGGRIVFEHFVDDPANPRPPAIHALKPGQLRKIFQGFRIERYDEVDGVGDWGGPGSRLVRMVAAKRGDS